jgi:dienelactone hydrolase
MAADESASRSMTNSLDRYQTFDFQHGPWTRKVFQRGTGPAVIIIHEIPGLNPLVLRFADRVADAGLTVYLPSLFGVPGRPASIPYALGSILNVMCVRREFTLWSGGRSSPIVDWLRALARRAHKECGGRGVGAIGLCLTGGFAIAMMLEPKVIAPALVEPSLPLPLKPANWSAIDASEQEIACARQRLLNEDLTMIGLRFRGDPLVPKKRFETLKRAFGDRFDAIELDPADADPKAPRPAHAVLTLHLNDDDPEGPTRKAETYVIEFFRKALGAS